MTTTDIHASFAPHKMWEERESETTHACKAAFQTDAHTGEMHTVPRENEPLSQPAQGHDGGMNPCTALDYADDTRITATEYRVLSNIAKGYRKRADLARASTCSVPTVARAIAKLVSLEIITRTEKKGRPSLLVINTRITDDTCIADDAAGHIVGDPSARIADDPHITGDAASRIMGDSRIAGDTAKPVDNKNPAHIRNAGARAEPLTNITLPLELNPEPEEASGKGVVLPPDQKTEPPPEEPPKKARAKTAYSSDFEAVWKLWPSNRRGNSDKKLAFKRYQQGVIDYGAEKIEAAARRYLSLPDTRKENFQFCCLVEVFMNGKLEAAVEAIEDAPSAAFIEPHERNGIRPRAF